MTKTKNQVEDRMVKEKPKQGQRKGRQLESTKKAGEKAKENIRKNKVPPRKPMKWLEQKEIRLEQPLRKNFIKDNALYHQEETKEEVKEETKEPRATETSPEGCLPGEIPAESDQQDMSIDLESEYDPEEEKQTVDVTHMLHGTERNSAAVFNSERPSSAERTRAMENRRKEQEETGFILKKCLLRIDGTEFCGVCGSSDPLCRSEHLLASKLAVGFTPLSHVPDL